MSVSQSDVHRLDYQSVEIPTELALPSPRGNWFGWSIFLGSSWTWCIGMFLPVLLVRDFGVWGWIVFAVPNVIGAAAMGWVLRSAKSSARLVEQHRFACQMFSAVTIAFHLFFVVAVVSPLAQGFLRQGLDLGLGGVLAAGALMYILMTRQRGSDLWLAGATILVSVLAMIWCCVDIAHTPEELPGFGPLRLDLLWLAPVCVFGFLGCPYLDLTFHRARQESASPRAAFGVGFGVVFLAMIVFTLIYSHAINDLDNTPISKIFGQLIFIHLAVQSAFTLAAHSRELRFGGAPAAAVAAVFTLGAWGAYWFLSRGDVIPHMRPGELIYRVFMGFYGLVFPAYVWLVMLPKRNGRTSLGARTLAVFAVAVLLALPMFWEGFVAEHMIWLVPGLALVLLARLLVSKPAGYATAAGL